MFRYGLRREIGRLVVLWAGLGLLGANSPAAPAAEQETRVFTVKIDGTLAGTYRMTIASPDSQHTTVDCKADISLRYLIKQFRYTYRGTEQWENGRLVQLKSETYDDGKQYQVLVHSEATGLRVRVNGTEHTTRSDAWTTTYWHAPDPKAVNQIVVLLDCDSGKELRANLQEVGAQQISAAGQIHNCIHYRLRGDVKVDVWYDNHQRLVRQEYEEDGHRVTLELTRSER